jgi:hypothetical protein
MFSASVEEQAMKMFTNIGLYILYSFFLPPFSMFSAGIEEQAA